jgi:hypothetical protein
MARSNSRAASSHTRKITSGPRSTVWSRRARFGPLPVSRYMRLRKAG